MTNKNVSHNASATYAGLALNPRTAALLSIVPGLGQLYIGETRKSILYLVVAAANGLIFVSLLLMRAITGSLESLSNSFHMRVNDELIHSMSQLQFGSAVSGVVLLLFCLFVGYAMREAYDRAQVLRRKQIYPETVIDLSEAASGSYLFHVSLIFSVLILTFFFLVPSPVRQQITEIEFMQQDAPVKTPVKTTRRDVQAHEDAGKHENRPVTANSARAHVESKPAPPSQADITPVPPAPQPAPHPVPHMAAIPMPALLHHPVSAQPVLSYVPHVSTPAVKTPALPNVLTMVPTATAGSMVAPSKIELSNSSSGTPMPTISHNTATAPSATAPGPIAASKPGNPGAPAVSESVPRSHVPVEGGTPVPTKVAPGSQAGHSGPVVAILPRLSGPAGASRDHSTSNPDETTTNKGASAKAREDIDFGPYMADLQRRIKRAWFPPKNGETLRVVVIFTIHEGGELSNLRLQKVSGLALADQAALKAVQSAAPFAHLPQGASDSVDIQFTFDYNVFIGK